LKNFLVWLGCASADLFCASPDLLLSDVISADLLLADLFNG